MRDRDLACKRQRPLAYLTRHDHFFAPSHGGLIGGPRRHDKTQKFFESNPKRRADRTSCSRTDDRRPATSASAPSRPARQGAFPSRPPKRLIGDRLQPSEEGVLD